MQKIDSNRELVVYCLLQSLLRSLALHPLDRMCLKEHMGALEESLSKLPHWRNVFELTFEDDPMDIPLVHSLRAKIILENSLHEGRERGTVSEDSLLESIETWIYSGDTSTPASGKKFLFILAEQTFSVQFYNRVLDIIEDWRRSQFQDVNRRQDPEHFDDLENACSYFISKLST